MKMPGKERNNQQVAQWLLLGVAMIVVQVILGGITRLTESGLSITEWNPITGVLPPMGTEAWQAEFDKYKNTDQFKYVHQHFTLSDFKFIFFWEWFHRLWARIMGLVFLAGFVYFIVKQKFSREMVSPMVILFLLGALQGAIGWIMVKSGLIPEKYFVGQVELATHFIAAIVLLVYTLWFALSLLPSMNEKVYSKGIRNLLILMLILLFVQLTFGAFMAGLKAGQSAPTWPGINGAFAPQQMNDRTPWFTNITDNPLMVQFIHRGLAYLLFVMVLFFYFYSKNRVIHAAFTKYNQSFTVLIIIQVLLGIFTLLNATYPNRLLWLGVLHQLNAIFIMMNVTVLMFLVRARPNV